MAERDDLRARLAAARPAERAAITAEAVRRSADPGVLADAFGEAQRLFRARDVRGFLAVVEAFAEARTDATPRGVSMSYVSLLGSHAAAAREADDAMVLEVLRELRDQLLQGNHPSFHRVALFFLKERDARLDRESAQLFDVRTEDEAVREQMRDLYRRAVTQYAAHRGRSGAIPFAEREAFARHALGRFPGEPSLQRMLLEALVGQKRHEEAETLGREWRADPEAARFAIEAAVARGRLEEAIGLFLELPRRDWEAGSVQTSARAILSRARYEGSWIATLLRLDAPPALLTQPELVEAAIWHADHGDVARAFACALFTAEHREGPGPAWFAAHPSFAPLGDRPPFRRFFHPPPPDPNEWTPRPIDFWEEDDDG